MNLAIIMGHLTADPETNTTAGGINYTRFTIAVDREYKQGDEKMTDFIPCTAWRQTGDFVKKYFHKGNMIAVEGALRADKYTDKDGKNRTAYSVQVTHASFCGEKTTESGAGAYSVRADAVPNNTDEDDPDAGLPF